MKSNALRIGVLTSTNYVSVLVTTLLFPIFPAMAAALDLTLRDLGFLVAMSSFPAVILSIVGGMLADRIGRKLVMVISLILYGMGGLGIGIAVLILENPWPFILFGKFLQGVGTATPMFLTVALVGDMFAGNERSRVLGYLETANGLGKISSPILGGAIGLIAWPAVFFLYPLLTFPLAIATWFAIDDSHKPAGIDWKKHKQAFLLFANRSRALTLIAAYAVIFLLIGTMFWISDFIEARIELNKFILGLIISIPSITMVITTLFAGTMAKISNPRILIAGGILVMSGGIFLLAFTAKTLFFWPVIALIGIGAGLALPSIDIVSAAVSPKIRGTVATVYGGFRSLGSALAPIVFSILLEAGIHVVFLSMAAVGLLTAILMFWLIRPHDFEDVQKQGQE